MMEYEKEQIKRYLVENTPFVFDMATNDIQYDPRNINYKIYKYIKELEEEIEKKGGKKNGKITR